MNLDNFYMLKMGDYYVSNIAQTRESLILCSSYIDSVLRFKDKKAALGAVRLLKGARVVTISTVESEEDTNGNTR